MCVVSFVSLIFRLFSTFVMCSVLCEIWWISFFMSLEFDFVFFDSLFLSSCWAVCFGYNFSMCLYYILVCWDFFCVYFCWLCINVLYWVEFCYACYIIICILFIFNWFQLLKLCLYYVMLFVFISRVFLCGFAGFILRWMFFLIIETEIGI